MYDPNAILGFDPASYQGNNQTPPASLEDLFLSIVASSEDLHLEGSGHNAIDTGLNLAGSVDDDIDGNSRPIGSGWEIGADERTASAATCASTEYVFNYCDTPIDISPGTTGSWVDVDLSSDIPSGATGAIVQFLNEDGSTDHLLGVRRNGSTDTWMIANDVAVQGYGGFLMSGVDSGRVLEIYRGDSQVKTYLIGYTMSGVSYFTNAPDKSLGTIGSYQDIDISADTGGETAIGAIFTMTNSSGGDYSLRKKGSSDDHYQDLKTRNGTAQLIGVDANEVAELKIAATSIDTHLTGYVTSGAVFFTNALNKSTGTTGSYVDVDITGDIGSDNANGAILDVFSTDNSSIKFGVRAPWGDHWHRRLGCFRAEDRRHGQGRLPGGLYARECGSAWLRGQLPLDRDGPEHHLLHWRRFDLLGHERRHIRRRGESPHEYRTG
jgi:hypothetical protein